MSGSKIVGSATEGLISILHRESPWSVSWSPPTHEWRMAAREGRGQRWKRGCGGPDGGCGKSRKTASQRRAWCWGWEGGVGGKREEALEAATAESGGERELGSSSSANPRLRVDVMKTKHVPKVMDYLNPQNLRDNVTGRKASDQFVVALSEIRVSTWSRAV